MRSIDASSLALLVNPESKAPTDPSTGEPVERAAERLRLLLSILERERDTLIIPTPALAEVLVKLEDSAPAILERINRSARFKIADFDQRAAIELAIMTREALRAGDKFGSSTSPWQKVKIDRQIVSISAVHGATTIYSDDEGLSKFARARGLNVIHTWDLPLPEDPTPDLFADLPPEHQGG